MYPTSAYTLRRATEADDGALRRLAELDSQVAITGPALIGEIDGAAAGAISLIDGRLIADPFRQTAPLTQILRMRYAALRAHADTPSLPATFAAAQATAQEA